MHPPRLVALAGEFLPMHLGGGAGTLVPRAGRPCPRSALPGFPRSARPALPTSS